MSFRVRLRLPSSKQETLALSQPVTIRSLLEGIQPFVDVDPSKIELRLVYPPKQLDLGPPSQWDRDVKSVGINNGEGLVVSVGTGNDETSLAPSSSRLSPPPSKPADPTPAKAVQTPHLETVVERPRVSEKVMLQSSRARQVRLDDEPPEIDVEGGSVILRIMADDNSCLYIDL